jgi:hypothetical protein
MMKPEITKKMRTPMLPRSTRQKMRAGSNVPDAARWAMTTRMTANARAPSSDGIRVLTATRMLYDAAACKIPAT